ncbi:MAG: hypothetical protein HKN62_05460, partial [Phycisphaerales bacterium]|nr:hypothetical protein [Phycisphaerales bacterium]
MSGDLQPGRRLLDRFVLQRRLHATAGSHLWFAGDERLSSTQLLQIYPGVTDADDAVREAIIRSVRAYRRVRHRHLSTVGDLHEADDLLVVSMDAGDGRLLSEHASPLPHRELVRRCRPLVDALVHLHDGDGEHGRIDAAHILRQEPEDAWVLLPGDGTQPHRPDLRRLGDLMATVLTGGRPSSGSVNNAPELLHEGRTVPALLDQLIRELREADPSARLAGMRDVATRLDQIDEFAATAPPPPAPRPASPQPTRVPAASR